MDGVAQGALRSFEEKTLVMRVLVFGNVAVALAPSEMLENGTEVNHDVSGYLLLKVGGGWRIAAHAWDKASTKGRFPRTFATARRGCWSTPCRLPQPV